MSAAALRRPRPTLLFPLAALSIVIVCVTIVRSRLFAQAPDIAAWGVTFDLTITIPLLWYFVVVRTGHAKPLTLAPVFVIAMTVAALVVPRGHQDFLHALRFASAPLEVVTLVLLGRRMARLRNVRGAQGGDTFTRIDRAARELFGDNRAATFVAMEVTILYYSVTAWRKKSPRLANAITVHEESGWGSIVACILVLLVAESIGAHFLVQLWFGRAAAWVMTSLDVYGILWIIGDYHALRLRVTTVEDGVLRIRHGLRWSADVPLDAIRSIDRVSSESEWKGKKTVMKLALVDEPRWLIRLHEPIRATFIAGIPRTIEAIAVRPDDEGAFGRALGGA